jgi:hypothetical protein
MSYVVFCERMPDNPSFKIGAGAWKVRRCVELEGHLHIRIIPCPESNTMLVPASRPYRKGSYCSPKKIVYEFLEVLRGQDQPLAA